MKTARQPARPKEGPKAAATQPDTRRTAGVARARAPRATPEALAALRAAAHPLRLRLLELFAQGARTTKQAAADLGEPPTRLYHHVHALERAGLVRLVETRAKRGTEEKYYALAPGLVGGGQGRGRGRLGTALARIDPADAARAGVPLRVLAQAVLDATRADVAAALTDVAGHDGRQHVGGGSPPDVPLIARAVVPSAAMAADLRAELLAVLRRHRARPAGDDPEADAQALDGADAITRGTSPAGTIPVHTAAWSLTVVLVPIRGPRPSRGGAPNPGATTPRHRH